MRRATDICGRCSASLCQDHVISCTQTPEELLGVARVDITAWYCDDCLNEIDEEFGIIVREAAYVNIRIGNDNTITDRRATVAQRSTTI